MSSMWTFAGAHPFAMGFIVLVVGLTITECFYAWARKSRAPKGGK